MHQFDLLLLKVSLQTINQRYIPFKARNWRLGLPQWWKRLMLLGCCTSSCLSKFGWIKSRVSLMLVWLSWLSKGRSALVVAIFKDIRSLGTFICMVGVSQRYVAIGLPWGFRSKIVHRRILRDGDQIKGSLLILLLFLNPLCFLRLHIAFWDIFSKRNYKPSSARY